MLKYIYVYKGAEKAEHIVLWRANQYIPGQRFSFCFAVDFLFDRFGDAVELADAVGALSPYVLTKFFQ